MDDLFLERIGKLKDRYRIISSQYDSETRGEEKFRLKPILEDMEKDIGELDRKLKNKSDHKRVNIKAEAQAIDLEQKLDDFEKLATNLESCIIVIKIEPYQLISEDKFILKIWRLKNDKEEQVEVPWPDLNNSDRRYFFKLELEVALPSLINKLVAGMSEVVFEVILPLSLLDWNPNNKIVLKIGCRERDIGTRYPVVIRSWERIYHQDYFSAHASWKGKWLSHHTLSKEQLYCLNNNDICYDSLFDELENNHTVFISSSLPSDQNSRTELLSTVLAAGIPFGFWFFQKPSDFSDVQIELNNWLAECEQWPKKVLEKRKHNALWNELVMLWDNPNSLPPDAKYLLTSPE